jgi:hypothetical protein
MVSGTYGFAGLGVPRVATKVEEKKTKKWQRE